MLFLISNYPYELKLALFITQGLFWTATYIECVRVGFKQKTYAVPFVALCLNFGWEFYYTIQGYLSEGLDVTTSINLLWLSFDTLILVTYFKYGNELKLPKIQFYGYSIAFLTLCVVGYAVIGMHFDLAVSAVYAGFAINILMSLLFIRMLIRRPGTKGQNMFIAVCKCLGTVFITIAIGVVGINRIGGVKPLILYTGILILILDLAYIFLLKRAKASHKAVV
ncbi:transmembrane-type terpene cyclase [Nonlabens marinus]|uniref:Uncharacterized protein n=1 Tax=Nonlabens marinus S1-08 TaxID=1454201 RepID=W8VR90_9FLAO|nr:hypothetical protein [Nonlabens marinus]BAO56144.1 hypothetical protein NMS_2135 [Nonlabens marinus S1-08]